MHLESDCKLDRTMTKRKYAEIVSGNSEFLIIGTS